MKGNVIVGQSGGPTAVINSSLAGVFQASMARGAKRVYGMCNGIEGLLEERLTDLTATLTSTLHIELLKRTPSSYLGSCRYKLPEPEENDGLFKEVFALLQKYDIRYFFYIGGNDSMDTIDKLSRYALAVNSSIRFIGVPKTIDNDLVRTDHTPGYGSAAKYLASTLKEVIRDGLVYNRKNITIVEVMGRNAGWLTAAAALAKGEDCHGVDMICLPETVFDPERFFTHLEALQKHRPALVIAVSEGIKLADGRYVCELGQNAHFVDAFGHKALSGTASYLCQEAQRILGCKGRAIELSSLQRCAAHLSSRVDITEAYQVGGSAVKAASEGETARMVALERLGNDPYISVPKLVPIEAVANQEKKLPTEWITPDGHGVTKEFISYVYPLTQAELTPVFVEGLPRHISLED